MTAPVQADPHPLPPLPPAPHPSPPFPPTPIAAREELEALTGPLPGAASAVARWGEELAQQPDPPGSDLLEPTRRATKKAAGLLDAARGGGRRG